MKPFTKMLIHVKCLEEGLAHPRCMLITLHLTPQQPPSSHYSFSRCFLSRSLPRKWDLYKGPHHAGSLPSQLQFGASQMEEEVLRTQKVGRERG